MGRAPHDSEQATIGTLMDVAVWGLEINEMSDLDIKCNDEGGSLCGSIALVYYSTRWNLTLIKPLTSYLVDFEMTSTRYIVAEASAMDTVEEAIAIYVKPWEVASDKLRPFGTYRNTTPSSPSPMTDCTSFVPATVS